MIADRTYSPGSLPFLDRRASLFYFAAAVPAVGFVHGPADVNPLNEADARKLRRELLHEPRGETRNGRLAGRLSLGVRCAYR